jgi:hypothetical protein
MYYSMNDMKEQLTNSGIMMSNGDVIATDVMVEHNVIDNEIRYSYQDDTGLRYGTMGLAPYATAMFDNSNRINGILTNKPDPHNDWYLFWTNN